MKLEAHDSDSVLTHSGVRDLAVSGLAYWRSYL